MITSIKILMTKIKAASGAYLCNLFRNLCNQVIAGFFSNNYLKVFLLLALWGTVLYGINIRAPFVFDDYKVIIGNPFIARPGQILELWKFDPTRFLPHVTLAWNVAGGSRTTLFFHIVNLVLHIICAFLVYLLVEAFVFLDPRILKSSASTKFFTPPLVASFLFLSHPIQTAAVSFLSQRSAVMVAVFYVAAVLMYLYSRIYKQPRFYYAALGFGLLGALCKPTIATLPLAILLSELLFAPSGPMKLWRRILFVIPFFLVVEAVAGTLILLQHSATNPYALIALTRQTNTISRLDYLLTQFNVLVKYIQLLFFPISQNLDYNFPIFRRFFEFPTLLSFSALAMLVYVAVFWVRKNRWLAFGVFWFFLTLSVESSIFPLEDVIFEHRLYLTMVGFAVFVTAFLFRIESSRLRNLLAAGLVLILSVLTINRNYVWADAERLYKDTMIKSAYKLRPIYNLVSLYLGRGQINAAEEQLHAAMRLDPGEPMNSYNMGRIYEQKKDTEGAIQFYSQGTRSERMAIAAESFWRLGYLTSTKGDVKNAELFYQASLEINPHSEFAHCDLGNLLNTSGRVPEAIDEYKKAVQINPFSFNGRNGLAAAYIMNKDFPKGVSEYEALVRLYPQSKIALMNLAKVYFLKKELLNIEPLLKRALMVDPTDPEIYYYLALLSNELEDPEEGRRYLERAVELLKSQGQGAEAEKLEKILNPPPAPPATPAPVSPQVPVKKSTKKSR